jgi:transcriptional regulator with PAS, ATPase and Fis domain
MVGNSPEIKQVLSLAMTAAGYGDLPVLITGESGTGKEIIARLIHHAGERKANTFLGINCSAIPENMLESEFFGYRRGAFTGALADRKGFFEYSDKGTLFLDELADMPLMMQSKLLRVIEDKTITKLGMDRPIPVNVRIISATNHDLAKSINEGKFRLDLYHRINTFQIHIPPLRERPSDIPIIANHYLQKLSNRYGKPLCILHQDALAKLMEYSLPGNVRELKNLIERAILISTSSVLLPESFPLATTEQQTSGGSYHHSLAGKQPESYNLDLHESDLIKQAMLAAKNNQTKAALMLGISRHALIRKLKHLDKTI